MEVTDKSRSFEQRVKDAVGHYRKKTIVEEDVKCTIVKGGNSVYTMYATYFLYDTLAKIKDLEIVVDSSRRDDPHLEICLCHELGHLENALQAVPERNKRVLEPTTWLQKLRVEIMADRKAAQIYGAPAAERVVSQWLKDELKHSIINHRKAVSRKANTESIVFFLIRYIFNTLFLARTSKRLGGAR
jgi:hypothetical protein